MQIVGLGTDIIECLRIAQMIEKHGDIFLRRVYSPHEIDYCQMQKGSTEHYAGRWAAKEAVMKAIGTGWSKGVNWHDLEVRNRQGGAPVIMVRGTARDVIVSRGIGEILISISHCRTHATAVAIALAAEPKTSSSSGALDELDSE